jgi:hypothetical protein
MPSRSPLSHPARGCLVRNLLVLGSPPSQQAAVSDTERGSRHCQRLLDISQGVLPMPERIETHLPSAGVPGSPSRRLPLNSHHSPVSRATGPQPQPACPLPHSYAQRREKSPTEARRASSEPARTRAPPSREGGSPGESKGSRRRRGLAPSPMLLSPGGRGCLPGSLTASVPAPTRPKPASKSRGKTSQAAVLLEGFRRGTGGGAAVLVALPLVAGAG